MKKYIWYGLIGAAASLLAIFFISRSINVDAFFAAWARAQFIYGVFAAIILFIGLGTRAIRWRILLSDSLPLQRSFNIMNVSYLINGFVPFRLGEAVRAYLASKGESSVPLFTSAATIVVERLLDLLTVVLLITIGLIAGPVPPELRSVGVIAGIASVAGFAVLIFFARQRDLAHRFTGWLVKLLPVLHRLRVDTWLDHFLDGLHPLTKTHTLLLTLLWTAISWILSIMGGYVGMLAFYDQASLIASCIFIAAAALSIAVPAVPGAIGTYEASIIVALGAVGYTDIDTAAAFAVSIHMINIVVYAIGGAIGIMQEGVTWDTFRKASAS